ncbi:MAG: ATP-binding protein [Desulfobacula sp.]|jgi:anti-sigma regulatory factor (Ser/Thr protein kinase)
MELDRIHINVTARPENLKQIRAMMARVTSAAALSETDAGAVILAVDEACSNIIKHCCKDDPTRSIDVTITLDKESLCVTMVDNGECFDIKSIKPRDIEEIKPGGLGVHIIREVMDVAEYSHTPEGLNQVKLVKKLAG